MKEGVYADARRTFKLRLGDRRPDRLGRGEGRRTAGGLDRRRITESDSDMTAPAIPAPAPVAGLPGWTGLERGWLLAVLLVAAVFRFGYLRGDYAHPDEPIVLGVVAHLHATGDFDTNWKAAHLPAEFDQNQFNFSGYNLAAWGWTETAGRLFPATWRHAAGGVGVIRVFSALLGLVAVALAFALGRRFGGPPAAVLAGLLTAVAPLLVQDSHYGRPETFVTALTMLVVWLTLEPGTRPWRRVVLAAFLVGFLVATKVTLGALAVLPLGAAGRAARQEPGGARNWIRWLGWVALGGGAGLFAGMPYAFFAPGTFFAGVGFLWSQYSGFHPPHNHFDGHCVGDLETAYLVHSLGFMVLLFAAGAVVVALWRRQWARWWFLAAPVVFYFAYFATKKVFFERNLSQVVPLLAVLAGVGGGELLRAVGAGAPVLRRGLIALVAVVLLQRPAVVSLAILTHGFSGRAQQAARAWATRVEAAFPGVPLLPLSLLSARDFDGLAQSLRGGGEVLVRVPFFNDSHTAHFLPQFERRFFVVEVARRPGVFPDAPVSTLAVYFGSELRYYLVSGER